MHEQDRLNVSTLSVSRLDILFVVLLAFHNSVCDEIIAIKGFVTAVTRKKL